jgi:S-adenosylmethionine uptake transporter
MQHLWRGAIGVTALWLWFYSFTKLPLATAMTLKYMSPIWIATILFAVGWWRGKSRFEWGLTAAIVFSFVGVTLLLRPSMHADQWFGGAVALVSGMLSALAYLQVRHLGQQGEPEYRVVFYFSVTGLVAGLCGTLLLPAFSHGTAHAAIQGSAAPIWHTHSAKGILLLFAIGVSATSAQMAMTRAYRLGKTLVTANLQYTGIVFSSAWGFLVWGDVFGGMGWIGIGVILLSGIAATFYNTRNAAAAPVVAQGEADVVTDPIATEV